MRYFALLTGNTVTNVIVANAWPGGIDVTDLNPRPSIGWTYDGVTFSPPVPTPVTLTQIERTQLLARMTPVELHGWYRAAQRAANSNTPTDADRNALYAWLRWEAMHNDVDLSSSDIIGLGNVWIALGMSQARATELLSPLIVE